MFKRLNIGRIAFFIFLFSVSSALHAVIITSTKSEYVPEGIKYYFTVADWLNGDGKFCDDMNATTCTLQINGLQSPGNTSYMNAASGSWEIPPKDTMEGVLKEMQKVGFSIPWHGFILVRKGRPTSKNFCISFVSGYRYGGQGGAITPIGTCSKAIEPSLQCDIKGDTTINHHDISSDAIDGNEAETQLQLVCTGATSVTVKTTADDTLGVKLREREGLYSKLTIDGKKTANGLLVKIEDGLPTNVSLKSTLVTKGIVKPGDFAGSTVLTISPP
ncbi:MrpH family fimbial adhesin [Achromobacter marplatensis]|uniref:MrpH family fimbial adhesin n=1 Tax=Achromobacter marplatensis TaxID=470868 RepID=UPI0039F73D52